MRLAHGLVIAALAASSVVCGACLSRAGENPAHGGEVSTASDAATPAPQPERARHFEERIAPLLARRCLECHGPKSKKGRLDLSRKDAALAGGENGPAVVAGKPGDSLLWQFVDADEMPKGGPPLSDGEKQALREWIAAGAIWTAEVIEPAAADPRAGSDWLRRLTVAEYIETVQSAVGVDIEQDARRMLPPDLRADGFSNTAYNLNVDLGHVEAYARLAELIVRRIDMRSFAAQFTESREVSEESLRQTIAAIGKWLLRAPLDEHELTAFLGIGLAAAKDGGDFDEALRYVIEAMLQSPRFIYRVEKQRGDGTPRRVDDYELACRLSYILWGGPPDRELMRAADAGELSDRGRVEAQVRRMLQDPRAIEKSAQFIREWLNLDHLANLRPSEARFPDWSEELAADMRDETLAFFKHVAWEQKRPLAELMNARVTFATPRLADHYGLARQAAALAGNTTGQPAEPSAERAVQRVTAGLQALYRFDERRGETVHETSGAGEPLHLRIADPQAVRWSEQGLHVQRSTLIAGEDAPQRLIEAIRKSNAVTLEAWVTPANAEQAGPARIVTLSTSVLARNFTLGQDGDKYDVRFRTTQTDASGIPSLSSAGGAVRPRPTHVVYTRDPAGRAKLYVNGDEVATREVGNDVSNWDGGFRLGLANEMSKDRTWLGTFHLVAAYDRALPADHVRQNHTAGPGRDSVLALAGQDDLQALYTFSEGGGTTIHDTSGAGEPLDLKIESTSAIQWGQGRLTVNGPTLIASDKPPTRLIDAARKSKSLTLEAWITPDNTSQNGPARILSLSSGTGQRNFTLGQDGEKFDVRLRTNKTDGNGLPSTPAGTVQTRPTHVVFTRDVTGRVKLYIDGEERAAGEVGGDFSNWDGTFRLALANETTNDRPWRGTFHRIAIYTRALTAAEIRARGPGLSRYDLANVPGRGGLLTQGSVLTVGGDEASMVTRGLFVLHNILDGTVEDPPPCVDTTPVPTKAGLSQRAVAEARLANQACGACHAKFEPLAFGLEKFNGLGAWHDVDEHGNTLREDGEILFPGQDQPVKFQSAAQLMNLLAGSDQVRRTITRKVTQFAVGRPLTGADAPVLESIHAAAQEGGGTYASLITAIVLSDLVQTTGTEAGSGQ